MTTATRDQEIQAIHTQYADFYRIGGGLALILIGVVIGAWIFGQNQFAFAPDMLGYVTNVSTEALSVIATIIVIDRLNRIREREDYKQSLIRQAGSIANDLAIDAIEQLRKAEWLTGTNGVLKGVRLDGANLEKARMGQANLQAAYLEQANLQAALLRQANLQNANLEYANLQNANLWEANLQNADLWEANLQNANLTFANLQAANLGQANLQNASLREANLQDALLRGANLQDAKFIETAKFDEKTVLPDAKLLKDADGAYLKGEDGNWFYDKYWTDDTDMTRYTDPVHPDFWQPDYLKPDFKGTFFDQKPDWATEQAQRDE